MKNLGGYMGKILRVDLTKGAVQESELSTEYTERFIGGAGYAARLLYDMVSSETDPFSGDNPLFFVAGPMVGSAFPGATKSTVCSISPLTGIWGEASASGSWGVEMKYAGFDGILVTGKSADPVFLSVREGQAEIRKAGHIWGNDTLETACTVKSDLGETKTRVASIGPAGERLVRFACIVTDEERIYGRTGMGAVMGSKNLKAIAVRGSKKIPIADPEKLREFSTQARNAVRPPQAPAYTMGRVKALSVDGTGGGLEGLEKQGGLPIKNWTRGAFPAASKISGPTMTKTILARPGTCPHCGLITCWRFVKDKDDTVRHGPEYETLASLGSLCMNESLESIVNANELCNRLGMDTISTGSVIAFAMECYENRVLTKDDLGGLELDWGNANSILHLTELIGMRKGFGGILADGARRAAEKIGKGSERYAVHVKGMEPPMHDPRRWWTMALAYATSSRGACHQQGMPAFFEWGYMQPEFGFSEKLRPFDITGMPEAVKFHQDFETAFTSMGHCVFTIGGVIPFTTVTQAFNAVTGRQVDHYELLKCGERIWNTKRAISIRMGTTQSDDVLPIRLCEPLKESPAAGKIPPVQEMVKKYYELRGWQEGKPTREKLTELGMAEVAKDIWK